jgi:hypothetical protein
MKLTKPGSLSHAIGHNTIFYLNTGAWGHHSTCLGCHRGPISQQPGGPRPPPQRRFLPVLPGDLSVGEYCHRMKGMADSLHDLGEPVPDHTLVLNLLHGLSRRYDHVKALIK